MIDALSNVLFIYILRHAQQIGLLNQGLLAALQDKRLNQVLEKILFSPQLDWNIEQLAELASMSRATFMRIFQQQLGMPPGEISYTSAVRNGGCFIEKYAKDYSSDCP